MHFLGTHTGMTAPKLDWQLTVLQESSDALSGVRLGRDQLVAQAT